MSESERHSPEQKEEEQEQDLKFASSAIDWRRNLVLRMLSEGHSQSHISRVLKVHRSTISIDCQYLREETRKRMDSWITEHLPMAVTKSYTALDSITSTAWDLARSTDDDNVRIKALNLIKDTEHEKLEIVSNVNIIDQLTTAAEKSNNFAEKRLV